MHYLGRASVSGGLGADSIDLLPEQGLWPLICSESVRPVHINRVQFFTGRACASVEVALEAWDGCRDVIWTSMRLGGNPTAEVPRYRNLVEFRFNN